MTRDPVCEAVRQQLMAALDGEAAPREASTREDARRHLDACGGCAAWVMRLESLDRRFQGLSYPEAREDLWSTVEERLRQPESHPPIGWLGVIAGVLLAWRTLQLLIDLPFPVLHPLVPLAAMLAALWLIARKPLSIVTFAPELQKRGL
jgi:anti-sigma factor RsiW